MRARERARAGGLLLSLRARAVRYLEQATANASAAFHLQVVEITPQFTVRISNQQTAHTDLCARADLEVLHSAHTRKKWHALAKQLWHESDDDLIHQARIQR